MPTEGLVEAALKDELFELFAEARDQFDAAFLLEQLERVFEAEGAQTREEHFDQFSPEVLVLDDVVDVRLEFADFFCSVEAIHLRVYY